MRKEIVKELSPQDEARFTDLVDNYLKDLRGGREPDREAILCSVSEESRPEVREQLEATWVLYRWQKGLSAARRKELIDRTGAGRAREFDEAVRKQRPALLAMVRAHVPGREQAEELLLDALLRARARFEHARVTAAQLSGWLRNYVQLWVRDYLLKRNGRAAPLREEAESFAPSMIGSAPYTAASLGDTQSSEQVQDRLIRFLEDLPRAQRNVLCLRFWYGLESKPSAIALGLKEQQVRQYLIDAVVKLCPEPAVSKPKKPERKNNKARMRKKVKKEDDELPLQITGFSFPNGQFSVAIKDLVINLVLTNRWTEVGGAWTEYLAPNDSLSFLYYSADRLNLEFRRFRESHPGVDIREVTGHQV